MNKKKMREKKEGKKNERKERNRERKVGEKERKGLSATVVCWGISRVTRLLTRRPSHKARANSKRKIVGKRVEKFK